MSDDNSTVTPVTTEEAPDSNEDKGQVEETTENNESTDADSQEQTEPVVEEEDPLEKSKRHADEKIRQLGTKAADMERKITNLVISNPQMLVDLYDPSHASHDPVLAEKIKAQHPDVYAKADAIYKEKLTKGSSKDQPGNPDISKYIAMEVARHQEESTKQSATAAFVQKVGLPAEDVEILLPQITAVATQLKQSGIVATYEEALDRAYIAVCPDDSAKAVQKNAYVKAAKKLAAVSPTGGGSNVDAPKSGIKLSDEDMEAIKASGLPQARYIQLKEKGLI